nr:MAG TPA: hypothetical protein [Caudoviricetes sp.]
MKIYLNANSEKCAKLAKVLGMSQEELLEMEEMMGCLGELGDYSPFSDIEGSKLYVGDVVTVTNIYNEKDEQTTIVLNDDMSGLYLGGYELATTTLYGNSVEGGFVSVGGDEYIVRLSKRYFDLEEEEEVAEYIIKR